MAYAIKISNLTPLQVGTIEKMLCLQPIHEEFYNKEPNEEQNKDPILFYTKDNDVIHIPLLFASALLNIIPNLNNQFILSTIRFTGQLRDYQIPIVQMAKQRLRTTGTVILGLPPGFGKTILSSKLSCDEGLLTCILVHRQNLIDQWHTTYKNNTNASIWCVDNKPPPPKFNVIICMNTRWHLIDQRVRDLVGFLIIDEAHAFCTPQSAPCLLAFHPLYTVACSATLLRGDGMESMIYAICGKNGIYREFDKPFNVIKVNTNTVPERKKQRNGRTNYSHLVSTTLLNERRNNIIFDIVKSNLHRKILILTSLVEHTQLLHTGLEKLHISSDFLCGSKKGYVDSSVLIGTVSKIGTGFDPATYCTTYKGEPFDLLILACSMKQYSMLVQNVGRVFRAESPIIYHLVDNDNIYKGHWYLCRKWYLSHNGTISEITIPNNELKNGGPQYADVSVDANKWAKSKIQSINQQKNTKPLI